jgi:hypothetical protein
MTHYLTKADLLRIRQHETDGFRFNQALADDYIETLDPTVKLSVVDVFAHQQFDGPFDNVMRAMVVLPRNGRHTPNQNDMGFGLVDLPIDEFAMLPMA